MTREMDEKISIIAGVTIGLCGFTLIVIELGWLPAIGLFCMVWGNNIQFQLNERGKQ